MIQITFRSMLTAAALALVACGGGEASSAAPAQDPTTAGKVSSVAKADIVDTANSAGSFKTLLAAVKAADLEGTLRGPGPFTVFAPTDEAFAKLPAGTVESLVKPENQAKLKEVLKYHVTTSVYEATNLTDGQVLGMANGGKATIHIVDGKMSINDAHVIASVRGSNGVVHVIDAVLLPPAP